ncbi:MAG: ImmA/IrrE family metallo-endopeptidase [Streptococcaceae bacterium]|jgi:hypothetical protein|nr:ImmA/IrrE family metallo-endopeptidase [Streptococcaceae bacterium]
MTKTQSFTKYIRQRFYNELFKALQDDVTSQKEHECSLYDMEVKSVRINDEVGMKLHFDVIVEATYQLTDETESPRLKWYQIFCRGNLEKELADFEVLSIEDYHGRREMHHPLSDKLIPIIKKEEFDTLSEDFLRAYYPEMLEKPQALNPFRLVERLNLTLSMRHLTEDGVIFGQIYFKAATGKFYSADKKQTYELPVEAGTIFIDPESYALRNLGSVNNTIVHECVHWVKHRKAFALKRLLQENLEELSCQGANGKGSSQSEEMSWMEWQAAQLAPRIMLPREMFKQKAEQLIREQREKTGHAILEVIGTVIDALAEFFGVSRLSAKIRLADVGYSAAVGAFDYIDGKYLRPYTFKAGSLKQNQTFSINLSDAAMLPFINQDFADTIAFSRYLYVESHFVLNTPTFLEDFHGWLRLTDYARHHMEECCLIFELHAKTKSGDPHSFDEFILNRDENAPFEFEIKFHQGYENTGSEKQRAYLETIRHEQMEVYNSLTNDWCECLEKVRHWREMTYQEIADKILMNERQVRRIFHGQSGKIESLVSICLALKLPPEISEHIISHSSCALNLTNTEHQWYHFVLMYYYGRNLEETRAFLLEHHAPL